MKTTTDLYWLVATVGLVMAAQGMIVVACLWHIMKLLVRTAATIESTAEWAREEEIEGPPVKSDAASSQSSTSAAVRRRSNRQASR